MVFQKSGNKSLRLQKSGFLILKRTAFKNHFHTTPYTFYSYQQCKPKVHMQKYDIRKISIFKNRFNLISANEEILIPLMESVINNEERPSCLYICGIYPRILPLLCRQNPFFLRRAANPYQILTILNEADQKLVIIEHDPSVYEDLGDVAEEIGRRCSEISKNSTVIYFWLYPDRIIRNHIERKAARITCIMQKRMKIKRLNTHILYSGQTTFERNWQ